MSRSLHALGLQKNRHIIHCVKSVRIRSYSGPHFPAFGLNAPVRMRENANQNNSKYGHFLRSDIVLKHLTVFLKGYNSQTLCLGIWQNFIYAYLSQRKQKTKVDWTFRDLLFVFRISPPDVFCKKVVLRNFAKFTGKHLCQSLFF